LSPERGSCFPQRRLTLELLLPPLLQYLRLLPEMTSRNIMVTKKAPSKARPLIWLKALVASVLLLVSSRPGHAFTLRGPESGKDYTIEGPDGRYGARQWEGVSYPSMKRDYKTE